MRAAEGVRKIPFRGSNVVIDLRILMVPAVRVCDCGQESVRDRWRGVELMLARVLVDAKNRTRNSAAPPG